MNELRRYLRYQRPGVLTFEIGIEQYEGVIENISIGGVAVLMDILPSVGGRGIVRINIPGFKDLVMPGAQVLRRDGETVGIAFSSKPTFLSEIIPWYPDRRKETDPQSSYAENTCRSAKLPKAG
jgi:hypothetical protein